MKTHIIIPVTVLCSLFLSSGCKEEPAVITLDSNTEEITHSTAVIEGRITKEGTSPVTECGFYWGDDPNNLQKLKLDNVTTDFSVTLSDLASQSNYYFKAYASSADGNGYGNVKEFIAGKYPPLWRKTSQSYNWIAWPNNVVFVDSFNIWMTTVAPPDANPIPDLPVDIFRSNDGGMSWSKSSIPGSQKLFSRSLSAIDGNNAWITVKTIGLLKTINGGASWTVINSDDNFLNHPVAVHFFNSNEGVGYVVHADIGIQKDSLSVIKTYDGGMNWTRVEVYKQNQLMPGEWISWFDGSIKAIGDTVAFGTIFGRIFMSYDRGNNWKIISYGSNPYLQCTSLALLSSKMFAFTSSNSVQLGQDTVIYSLNPLNKIIATVDGGTTWNESLLFSLRQGFVAPVHGLNTYIVTSYKIGNYSGKTFISTDAGRNFTDVDSLGINIGMTAFYSVYHGIGCAFNANDNTMTDKTNYIYKWSPEILLKRGKLNP